MDALGTRWVLNVLQDSARPRQQQCLQPGGRNGHHAKLLSILWDTATHQSLEVEKLFLVRSLSPISGVLRHVRG